MTINLEILPAEKALPLCKHDWYGMKQTEAALAAGRPAFWSAHLYHDGVSISAACTANSDSLAAALEQLLHHAACRQENVQPYVDRLLAKLWPANEQARAVLAAAAEFMAP